jgi:hypothetical protein
MLPKFRDKPAHQVSRISCQIINRQNIKKPYFETKSEWIHRIRIKIKKIKREIVYLVLRRKVYVPKAIATKAKATMIVARLENSGTVGVGSVLPAGVKTAW